jgi:uncharacterized protein
VDIICCINTAGRGDIPLKESNDGIVSAVNAGDAAKVTDLAQHKGGDANAKDANGIPVLTLACMKGQGDIVKILIGKGADVNAAISDGETSLMAASAQGYFEIVQQLVSAKANLSQTDNDGWTALEYAVNQSRGNIADYLKNPNR